MWYNKHSKELDMLSDKKEIEEEATVGKVMYNKDIINSIIQLATKEISGVASMASSTNNCIVKLVKGKRDNGVKVSLDGGEVVVDVFINIFSDANVKEIAWRIQENIKTSVQSMMNIKIKAVNINIVGVDFSNLEKE